MSDIKDEVRTALRATTSTLGLCFIPSAARSLKARWFTLPDIHAAILSLSEAGEIDLLADGGSEYLAPDDEALCPPGPRDTVFSRCRFL
jgi:hypothetical protein